MTLMYLVMENYLKVLEMSWKGHEKLEVKICTNPVQRLSCLKKKTLFLTSCLLSTKGWV